MEPTGFFIPDDCTEVVSAEHLDAFAAQGMTLVEGPGSGSTHAFDRFPVEAETTDIWCIWATPSFSASVEIDIGPVTDAVRPAIIDFLDIQYMTTEADGDVVRYFLADDYGLDLSGRVDMVGSEAWIEVQVYPGGPAAFESAKKIIAEVEAFTNAR